MLKKLLFAIAALVASMGFAFAQVDVNKADQTALDGITGIGPKISKTILDERKRGGDFKDWADFQARVSGIGDKNSVKLSQAGLTINGRGKEDAPTPETKKAGKLVKATQAAGSDSSDGSKGKLAAPVKAAQAAGSDSGNEAKAKPPVKVSQAAGSDSTPPKKIQARGSASASAVTAP